MKFYKIIAKMGHQGAGKFRALAIYTYANNLMEAIDKIRDLPAVKHNIDIPYTTAKEIDEQEFMTHYIFNAYYDFFRENKKDTQPIIPLDRLTKDFVEFMYKHEFTTHEGRVLKHFCKNYHQGDKDTKKQMNEAYILYATSLSETKSLD
ncbi:MAG: hypothetical protein ACLRFL_03600 [Clostridia bacterium]